MSSVAELERLTDAIDEEQNLEEQQIAAFQHEFWLRGVQP